MNEAQKNRKKEINPDESGIRTHAIFMSRILEIPRYREKSCYIANELESTALDRSAISPDLGFFDWKFPVLGLLIYIPYVAWRRDKHYPRKCGSRGLARI